MDVTARAFFSGLVGLWLAASGGAFAAVPAVVDTVQAPAWLERGGRVQPLAPDTALQSGDTVRTGAGGRAYLALAEGSMVKLGESARFSLHTRSVDPRRLFKGALDVAAGAFRFTTGLLGGRSARDVSIRVATATIGIRGTDVWGKAGADRDLVALIEGRIELTRGGEPLDIQPMNIMDAPKGGAATVGVLEPARLAVLARETEIEPGDGAHRGRGKWAIDLGTHADQSSALDVFDRAREAGYSARLRPIAAEGGGWRYEVKVRGYATRQEAEVAAARLAAASRLDARAAR